MIYLFYFQQCFVTLLKYFLTHIFLFYSRDEGSCNHVAALLYAVVDITVWKRDGLDASTSKKCLWNNPRKRKLSPKSSYDLCNKKPTTAASALDPMFLANLLRKSIPSCGFVVNVSAQLVEKKEDPLPEKEGPLFCYIEGVDLSSEECQKVFKEFASTQNYTQEEIFNVELATREQANCDAWHKLRRGKITASNFHLVANRRASTKPDKSVKLLMGYGDTPDLEALKWGRNHEAAARRMYALKQKTKHPGINVRKSGLVIDGERGYLACSPDGVITCTHCSPTQGLLEVKCPFAHRFETAEEACADDTFCCDIVNGEVKLKRKHKYYLQVQGQMAVTGKKWCDFVIWTLKGMSVERIFFDSELWSRMLFSLDSFYIGAMVPELFSLRVKRELPLFA